MNNQPKNKVKAAIIGSGNIGSDLMIKMLRHGEHLEIAVMVGIDPESDGLARAKRMNVATTHLGVQGLIDLPEFKDIHQLIYSSVVEENQNRSDSAGSTSLAQGSRPAH